MAITATIENYKNRDGNYIMLTEEKTDFSSGFLNKKDLRFMIHGIEESGLTAEEALVRIKQGLGNLTIVRSYSTNPVTKDGAIVTNAAGSPVNLYQYGNTAYLTADGSPIFTETKLLPTGSSDIGSELKVGMVAAPLQEVVEALLSAPATTEAQEDEFPG